MNKSQFGKPRKPVHWSNIHCTGKEQQISACENHEFPTMDEKKSILGHINVAGVVCQPTTVVAPTNMDESSNNDTDDTDNDNNNDTDCSSPQSQAVLLAPTYLTMLIVIVNFVLSIL